MLFSSITFLYIFLPVVILFCIFSPKVALIRNILLLLLSLFFYAWGEPVYVFLMLAEIAAEYILTYFIDRYRTKWQGKLCFTLSVIIPFIILFYYKYFGFFVNNLVKLVTYSGVEIVSKDILDNFHKMNIIMPIGISFYTFQLVSYCVDVYRKSVERQKNIITFATYVVLFPQLVAGPIVRYHDVEAGLTRDALKPELALGLINPLEKLLKMQPGIVRFTTGLAKKVLIANVLGELVNEAGLIPDRGIVLSWIYAFAVSLQIYFDFSGYSDMAIGLGTMLGFDFPENFRYPFTSKSISEFWRRWHITLGAWFRDYVYIPLGGNRVNFGRWIFNVLVVWFFTGLWHGAAWNFIIWGLYFAVFLVLEKLFWLFKKNVNELTVKTASKKNEGAGKLLCNILCHAYVVFVIMISFLIFHNTDMSVFMKDFASLFDFSANEASKPLTDFIIRNRIGILIIAIIGATPLPLKVTKYIMDKLFYKGNNNDNANVAAQVIKAVYVIVLLVICTAYIIDGSFNPFLYFRF